MQFHFDERKSRRLRANPKRGIGSKRRRKFFRTDTTLTSARIDPNSTGRSAGGEQLYTVIFEVREDEEGEYYHLVTLWKATKQEQQLYGEHS
jgi:uncharacterized DUF497 family protein